MSVDRRRFLKISSLTAANAALLHFAGSGAGHLYNTVNQGLTVDELQKAFLSPSDEARSCCYWWWFNGNVDKEGITRDLEEFRKQGVGSVFLISSASGLGGSAPIPQGAKFLSPEWKELFRFALEEAHRLNLEVGFNLCAGWAMGGPWIKPEDAGRWFLQSELSLTGPQKFSGQLPLPGNRSGYDNVFNPPGYKDYIDLPLEKLDYRDTVVVAFPVRDETDYKLTDDRAKLLPAKTNRKDASNFTPAKDVMEPTLVSWASLLTDKPIASTNVIDLTSKLLSNGTLNWDVPPGNWKIIRTGHRMTGSRLMLAPPEADGLSVGWLNSRGVEQQFQMLGKTILEIAGPLGGKTLKYFSDDSFEDGFPNWTDDILQEFKSYRGYDATPYLPVLAGVIVDSAEVSDRFLYDYRKTVADLMADRHYKRFAELCHQHDLQVQNEAAGPSRSGTMCMDGLKNLGRSDRPMGEFWLGLKHDEEGGLNEKLGYGATRLEGGQNKVCKMVSSAAHIYGKKFASAEAFTTYRHWSDSPATLKPAADRAFCEGINRIAIHTSTATRPKDGKPGYEYGAGTHFNPNVTWWDKSSGFLNYVGRCQTLLQSGKSVADVLYYNGDWAPNLVEPKHIDPLLGKGYDYDVCNAEVLLTRLSVKGGKLVLPGDVSYRLLVLPTTHKMPVEVAMKIKDLVKAGATLVGPKPEQDPGLKAYPASDGEVKNIGNEVWGKIDGDVVKKNNYGKGRVFTNVSLREILLSDGVQPAFDYSGAKDSFIDFIQRSTDDAEIYFLVNRNKSTETVECTFRNASVPELWDPVSGKIRKTIAFKQLSGRTTIPLEFAPYQSFFIVFRRPNLIRRKAAVPAAKANFPTLTNVQEIAGPWSVAFDTAWGGPASVEFSSLTDWTKHAEDGIKYYSGSATYIKRFDLARGTSSKQLLLDLGMVKNIASVKLNGKNLGIVWTAPWRVDITEVVKPTDNLLQIEVTNLWPNRLIGDAALPPENRLTKTNIPFKKEAPLLPSGLLGPVMIMAAT